MIEAAMVAAREIQKHPSRIKLRDVARMLDLASVLGRRSAGLPLDQSPAESEPRPPRPDVQAALNKIYGDDEGGASPDETEAKVV
jgi:hypothetical protein